jgi:hypothetical protein
MRSGTLPVVGAAALGFAAAALMFAVWTPRAAGAQGQFRGAPALGQLPIISPPPSNTPTMPQPIEIQSLDPEHFVVATREPRLVEQVTKEGAAQNMLVTVVTHYTVRGARLMPVEHVRVPAGYRAITIEE